MQLLEQNQPLSPDSNAAEVARIQRELEIEARRKKWHEIYTGVIAVPPAVKGITGWMLRRKIVQNEEQANLLLMAILVASVGLIIWINWPGRSGKNTAPKPTEQEIGEMNSLPSGSLHVNI